MLAGMGRISVVLGLALVTGEPIAEIDDNRPLPKRAVETNPYYMWNSARAGYPSIQAHGGP